MAEIAGLVIGGVSLSGLFTSCVDCFEYIQMGRAFGQNYTMCLLQLDIAKLKLSRWAESVNESPNQFGVELKSKQDATKVESILGGIIAIFAEAECVSKRFESEHSVSRIVRSSPENGVDVNIQSMHEKMARLAMQRQRRSKITQKMSWALYEEDHFRKILGDVSTLIDGLVNLFPPAQKIQRELCRADVEEVKSDASCLGVLEQCAKGVDLSFQEAIQHAASSGSSHEYFGNSILEEARAHYGDQIDEDVAVRGHSHKFKDNKSYGKSRALYGNKVGGKSILDD